MSGEAAVSVQTVFDRTGAAGRAAFIAYVPAGFPHRGADAELVARLVGAGVDIMEVGLPYSDPLMDGPVIEKAVAAALAGGTTTDDVWPVVEAVRTAGAAAVVMSYWNPVEAYGLERFAEQLRAAGGSGLITPDLPVDEADNWCAVSDEFALDRIFLVAPSSTDERLARVAAACRGFVYAASTMGVTGTRTTVSGTAEVLVQRTRLHTSLPVCVGLGVSTGEQAAEVARYADGVIVGSAIVRAVSEADTVAEGIRAAERLAVGIADKIQAAGS